MRKTLLASAAALLCAFNGTANAQTSRYDLNTSEGVTVDVFEYSQEDAREVFAAAPKPEGDLLNEVIIKMAPPPFGTLIQLTIERPVHPALDAAHEDIYERAVDLGYETDVAEKMAISGSHTLTNYTRARPFNPDLHRPINGFSPSAVGWSGGESAENSWPQAVAEYCLVINTGKNFPVAAWFEDFTKLELDTRQEAPTTYEEFFRKHVTYHEQAHCLGANEEQADYIASLQLMFEYKDDPEMLSSAKDFVAFYAALRTYSVYNVGLMPQYKYTGEANVMALRHIEQNGFEGIETTEDIWSMVSTRNYPTATRLNLLERLYVIATSDSFIKSLATPSEDVETAPVANNNNSGNRQGVVGFKR